MNRRGHNGHFLQNEGIEVVNALLRTAREYSDRYGWSVIPVVGKVCTVKWAQYQQRPPTDAELERMLEDHRVTGIAVVNGPVSNDLAIRDFDDINVYLNWKLVHADLANLLPTVKTAKGYHVYGRLPGQRVAKADGGELRGAGGYTLLPRSLHPSGAVYEWTIPPTDSIPDVTEADFGSLQVNTCNGLLESKGVDPRLVEQAIQRTLPTGGGQRNRRIFDYAREVRAFLPKSTDRAILKGLIMEWFQRALSVIRTKDFEESYLDFMVAWANVRNAKNRSFQELVAKARRRKPPAIAAQYDLPLTKLLVSICAELQASWGDQSFPLSARKAAEALGVQSTRTAWQHLQLLLADGVLVETFRGDAHRSVGGRASEYRYLGGQ